MAKTVDIQDFITHLKNEGLVIMPRLVLDEMTVGNVSLERYQRMMLRKQLLSAKEISDARFWGPIGKPAVKKIIKSMVPDSDQVTIGRMGTIKIPLGVVKSIALSRGYSWG